MNMNEINLKELREKNGFTQQALAQIMGVSVQTIKNWEAGKKIPSTSLMKLQDVFHLNTGDGNTIANNVNGDNVQNGGEVIKVLSRQLEEKDRQIDRLLTIIEKMNPQK